MSIHVPIDKQPFCMPLVREGSSILNAAEQFNWFGGRVANIVATVGDVSIAVETVKSQKCHITALKILMLIITIGLISLIALTIKALSRCCGKKVFTFQGDGLSPQEVEHATRIAVNTLNQGTALDQVQFLTDAQNPPPAEEPVPAAMREEIRRLYELVEPFNQQALARAKAIQAGRKSLPRVDITLVIDAIQRSQAFLADKSPAVQTYFNQVRERRFNELVHECPNILDVLNEIERQGPPGNSPPANNPPAGPRIRTLGDCRSEVTKVTPAPRVPLSQRPGGHVLGRN
jgi:hypothetical protein